ncbi:carbohydrate kinase family protein [Hoeflea sp.]|uniref:carbohydrate kinase family protein n=1 Tax=Hoeflea sp. TaxID=1940281 RepID=UPI003B016034
MTGLVVTGYASLDYPVGLAGQVGGDQTTLIEHRDANAWPRIGGCPAYMALAVSERNGSVAPVTWIGSGTESDHFILTLHNAGVNTDGIDRLPSPRAPTAILAYQKDGTCACLFDPVFAGDEELTQSQQALIASASHVCISVGPPHLTRDILASRNPEARLYWVVKNDARCFTPEICAEISGAADVVFCNSSERVLIGDVASETLIVETRGPDGILLERGGEAETLAVEPLPVRDTTGAGDTLAGGFVAAEMAGHADPLAAAQAGLQATMKLLEERLERQIS